MILQAKTDETAEGYTWTSKDGIRQGGLKCEGVISPVSNISDGQEEVYDVVVVGAGYTGLSAARDVATAGKSSRHPPSCQI